MPSTNNKVADATPWFRSSRACAETSTSKNIIPFVGNRCGYRGCRPSCSANSSILNKVMSRKGPYVQSCLNLDSLPCLAPRTWLGDDAITSLLKILLAGVDSQTFAILDSLNIDDNAASIEIKGAPTPATILVPLRPQASTHCSLAVVHRDRDIVDFYDSFDSDQHMH